MHKANQDPKATLRWRAIRGGTAHTSAKRSSRSGQIHTRCCFPLPYLYCNKCSQKDAKHDEEKYDTPTAPCIGSAGPLLVEPIISLPHLKSCVFSCETYKSQKKAYNGWNKQYSANRIKLSKDFLCTKPTPRVSTGKLQEEHKPKSSKAPDLVSTKSTIERL